MKNGSAIRALIKRKKHYCPIFFETGFRRNPSTPVRTLTRACVFVFLNRTFVGCAHRDDPFSQPSGSSAFWADVLAESNFEPKGADRTSPALLPPARFSWSTVLLPHALVLGKRVRSPTLRPSRHRRDQKTFSAGPRSFNSKVLWFPRGIAASGVQPVSDSRHGRIACKVSLSCMVKISREQPSPIKP